MNIKEFSQRSGLSAHTLRYYEKIGLLKGIQRNASGHRYYHLQDLEWANFIIRLKETAMPLCDILQYARLREQGPSTHANRQALLEQHQAKLSTHIQSQQQHLAALEQKINWYHRQVALDLE
ncbi:MerR family transcriptional regulator [Agarivorans sp. QJM3NY_29]|uniref:MerR family transcriptional regulator n=1 Tax=unclassified Agarivorans TaxID=2636026 RepID=UPI003D7D34AC